MSEITVAPCASVPGLRVVETPNGHRAVFPLFGLDKSGSTEDMRTRSGAIGHAYHLWIAPEFYEWEIYQMYRDNESYEVVGYAVRAGIGDEYYTLIFEIRGLSLPEARCVAAELKARGVPASTCGDIKDSTMEAPQ